VTAVMGHKFQVQVGFDCKSKAQTTGLI